MWAKEYISSANKAGVTVVDIDSDIDDDDVEADTDHDDDDADDKHEWQMPPIDNIETDHPICASLRTRAYRYAWSQCEQRIQSALTRIYEDTVTRIAQFARDPSLKGYDPLVRAVPTGLITGCGTISASALLPAIRRSLAEDGQTRPVIASIASWQCPNHRSACRSAIQAFAKAQKPTTTKKQSLVASDDFQTLVAWYRPQRGEDDSATTLLLYLEDFEAFDPGVLADLLYTISSHRRDLPLALLIPLATTVDSLVDALPRAASDLLQVKVCEFAHSGEAFQALVTATFSTSPPLPITLGAKVKSQLLRSFEDHDLSLEAVIAAIKYIYLSRFFCDPTMIFAIKLMTLCPEAMHTDISAALLAQAHLLRALPSFRRHIETAFAAAAGSNAKVKAVHQLLSSDAAVVAAVRAARMEYEARLQGLDSARQVAALLERTYQPPTAETKQIKQDEKLFAAAKTLARNIRFSDANKVSDLLSAIRSTSQLADSCGVAKYAERMQDLADGRADTSARTKLVNANILGAKAASHADKAFSQLVIELSDTLEGYFDRTFGPPNDILFHELWYCDDAPLLSQTFHPQITSHVGAALMDPSSRLPLSLLDDATVITDLQNGELDTVKAHRLVLEAGKFVNLADWHGAVLSAEADKAAEADEPRTPSRIGRSRPVSSAPGSLDNSDAEMPDAGKDAPSKVKKQDVDLAKFMQAVSDLAYLGHIQPTKRKAEHVARIVF